MISVRENACKSSPQATYNVITVVNHDTMHQVHDLQAGMHASFIADDIVYVWIDTNYIRSKILDYSVKKLRSHSLPLCQIR